jgi:NAD(P)-dependent dehydrogenase (short-subunit alcohol dehydrogenase family)
MHGEDTMKIVIVTGSSRGLGASTAITCAERGMGVIVTYNSNPGKAESVVAEIIANGGKAVALKLDVGHSSSFPAFRNAVKAQLQAVWGRETFDYLVNNAGYGLFNPIATVTEEQFDGLFNVHLKGPFFLTQILLPLMDDGGHRQHDQRHHPRRHCRCRALCRLQGRPGSADALHGQGVRRAPHPGQRHRAGCHPHRTRWRAERGVRGHAGRQTALARVGEPEEIGGVIASLLTEDENRWINAQNIEVAGGYIILPKDPSMLDHVFHLGPRHRPFHRVLRGTRCLFSGSSMRHDYDGKDGPPGHPDLKGFGANGRVFFWLREGVVEGRAVHIGFVANPRPAGRRRLCRCSWRPGRPRSIRRERSFTTTRATTRRQVRDPDGYSLEFVYKEWQH